MNLKLAYRPLVGGIGIVCSNNQRWGTLGLVAEGDAALWVVTAAHVLGDLGTTPRIKVYQGPWNQALEICDAPSGDVRADRLLDIAAVPLNHGVPIVAEIAHLGAWTALDNPAVGGEVVRVGVGTGLVRGVIADVDGVVVRIATPSGYPAGYSIGAPGDSGAVWLSWPALALIALHRAVAADGTALATALRPGLDALGVLPVEPP